MLLADIRQELWYDALASRRGTLAAEGGGTRRSWLAGWLALAVAVISLGHFPASGR
jgi:hypothetical protein